MGLFRRARWAGAVRESIYVMQKSFDPQLQGTLISEEFFKNLTFKRLSMSACKNVEHYPAWQGYFVRLARLVTFSKEKSTCECPQACCCRRTALPPVKLTNPPLSFASKRLSSQCLGDDAMAMGSCWMMGSAQCCMFYPSPWKTTCSRVYRCLPEKKLRADGVGTKRAGPSSWCSDGQLPWMRAGICAYVPPH